MTDVATVTVTCAGLNVNTKSYNYITKFSKFQKNLDDYSKSGQTETMQIAKPAYLYNFSNFHN